MVGFGTKSPLNLAVDIGGGFDAENTQLIDNYQVNIFFLFLHESICCGYRGTH